jgi:hypothetical protein
MDLSDVARLLQGACELEIEDEGRRIAEATRMFVDRCGRCHVCGKSCTEYEATKYYRGMQIGVHRECWQEFLRSR